MNVGANALVRAAVSGALAHERGARAHIGYL